MGFSTLTPPLPPSPAGQGLGCQQRNVCGSGCAGGGRVEAGGAAVQGDCAGVQLAGCRGPGPAAAGEEETMCTKHKQLDRVVMFRSALRQAGRPHAGQALYVSGLMLRPGPASNMGSQEGMWTTQARLQGALPVIPRLRCSRCQARLGVGPALLSSYRRVPPSLPRQEIKNLTLLHQLNDQISSSKPSCCRR